MKGQDWEAILRSIWTKLNLIEARLESLTSWNQYTKKESRTMNIKRCECNVYGVRQIGCVNPDNCPCGEEE